MKDTITIKPLPRKQPHRNCKHWLISVPYFMFWFHASLICINNCPTRWNTKQSIYYSASSLYMFRVSTTPIIKSTQNCNCSLRDWAYFLCSYLPQASLATLEGGSCTVPEAVVTVLCNPDDGCGWHPKHVEWTCRKIKRELCVLSRWTVNNVDRSQSYAPANYAGQLLVIFQWTLCLVQQVYQS